VRARACALRGYWGGRSLIAAPSCVARARKEVLSADMMVLLAIVLFLIFKRKQWL
jgi:hypothetical protein